MVNTTNTLLHGWPETKEILGKQGQFLGYRIENCRYPTPWGRKVLIPASIALWLGAFFLASNITAGLPKGEAGNDLLSTLAMLGGIGQFLLYRLLLGRLTLEIRPQTIRYRTLRGGWASFETRGALFAYEAHDRAITEQLKEQQRLQYAQYSRSKSPPQLPGNYFRLSLMVALYVAGQRVVIASVYGLPKAMKLYNRVVALLEDVNSRQGGQTG
jgi:hypothetical protein